MHVARMRRRDVPSEVECGASTRLFAWPARWKAQKLGTSLALDAIFAPEAPPPECRCLHVLASYSVVIRACSWLL